MSAPALRTTLDDALRRLSPKSEMAKAITYGRKALDRAHAVPR
jgi:hypothetical protein